MTLVFNTNDLSTGFTEKNPPITYVDDQHTSLSAFEGENVSKSLSRANVIASGGAAMSQAQWFKIASVPKLGWLMGQTGSGPGNGPIDWVAYVQTDGTIQFILFSSAANFVFSESTPAIDDDVWHRIMITGGPGDANIYIDGAEVAYDVQDTGGGTGFATFTNDGLLLVGDSGPQTGPHTSFGIVSRISVFDTKLSAAAVLQDFNDEVALIPSDDGTTNPLFPDAMFPDAMFPNTAFTTGLFKTP